MKPGQSAQLVSDGTFAVDEVDTETFLYWKEGFFYFDDVALVDMMKECLLIRLILSIVIE